MRILWLRLLSVSFLLSPAVARAGTFAPAAGQPGSTAIANNSSSIASWASGFQNLVRGPQDITNPGGALASFGTGNEALGPASGVSTAVVSLGDGGSITLTFAKQIFDGPGFDLAVFENGLNDTFLELAYVEVSSNGVDFARFAATSQTQTATQVGSFGSLDPTNLDNLAGKYRAGFGTPFDLSQLAGISPNVDVNHIGYVRIVDVVGTTNATFATLDSLGIKVNDPYPTAFASGGFDLDGVAVLNVVPEPSAVLLLAIGGTLALWRARRKRS